ncbi:MAG TPA: YkgJ family cysteine cluster protein [Rectinemataceae bacterium]|nr:YkgJ family cysteine cluster protein [Rectinemataceae bacterium]
MDAAFWDEGLRFGCTRCSRCCTGEPGYVFLAAGDVRRLMAALALDFSSLISRYCRFVDMGEHFALSLRERSDHSCIFWGKNGCDVYDARPIQCSTYPFWSSILESRDTWSEESGYCPGIDSGALHARQEIEEALASRRASGLIRVDRETARKAPELLDEAAILGR